MTLIIPVETMFVKEKTSKKCDLGRLYKITVCITSNFQLK